MISPKCSNIYGSSGIDDVMQGIEDFFTKYSNPFWIFEDFPDDTDHDHTKGNHNLNNPVEIRLHRYWTDIVTNKIYKCSASEIIDFDDQGLITTIYYTVSPSTPIECQGYPQQRDEDLRTAAEFLRQNS